nr:reverse transcriptase domain-containing protein [Tanacetum cinerariifolium]
MHAVHYCSAVRWHSDFREYNGFCSTGQGERGGTLFLRPSSYLLSTSPLDCGCFTKAKRCAKAAHYVVLHELLHLSASDCHHGKAAPKLAWFQDVESMLNHHLADEYEVREAAGTMDPLTPNRVAFPALIRSLLASFLSSGRVSSFKYSIIGVIHIGPSSSTTVTTFFSCMDFSLSISTKTCFDKCAKLVDAILLRASAFLFLLLGTWLMEKLAKPLTRLLAFSRSTLFPPRLVNIRLASDPSTHDDLSVNKVYDSYRVLITDVSGEASSGFSTRKSARICPFTDVLGRTALIALGEADKYTISSSLGLGATSMGSSDKCCFRCLMACFASGVQWKSLFLMHFFKVLNNGKDFYADLERNLLRLANFPLRPWTSLIVRGDESRSTTSVLSGHSIKVNGVIDNALHLYLFPHSLTHHATAWFDRLPRNSITTFEQMAKMFLGKYFPPSMVTKLRNEITNFRQRPDESLFEAWEHYILSIDRYPNHNMLPVTQIDTFYNGLTLRHRDIINAAAGGTFMTRRLEECYDLIENMTAHHNDWDTSVQRSESSSSITSFSDPKIIALKAEMAKSTKTS